MTTRFKEGRCLDCGKTINSASRTDSRLEDVRPSEGDIAICFGCGHVMIYADGEGTLRQPTDDELVEIAGDPEMVEAQNRLAAFRRMERKA